MKVIIILYRNLPVKFVNLNSWKWIVRGRKSFSVSLIIKKSLRESKEYLEKSFIFNIIFVWQSIGFFPGN